MSRRGIVQRFVFVVVEAHAGAVQTDKQIVAVGDSLFPLMENASVSGVCFAIPDDQNGAGDEQHR